MNDDAEFANQIEIPSQKSLDSLEYAELIASLRQAIAEFEAGKGIPLEEVMADLNERYGA